MTEQIAEEADRQLYDEDNIKREFVQLEIEAEEGRLGPQEREAKEDELLERMAVARQRRLEEQEFLEGEAWEVEQGTAIEPTTEETEGRTEDG